MAGGTGAGAGAGGELVRGFRMLRLPVAAGSCVTRSLLVKRHVSRDPAEADSAGRTLFVSHLDNFVSEAQLTRSFGSFGPVEKVEMRSTEKRAPKAEQRADKVRIHVNFARVVFQDAASLDKAMEASNGRIASAAVLSMPGSALKEQLKLDKALYRDHFELRKEIDTWMSAYDAREEEKKRLARESATIDDDGFQKVVSGITRTADGFAIRSAKRPSLRTGAFAEPISGGGAAADAEGGDRRKRKKKDRERPDFYKFQQREKRREEIIDSRKRRVEDEDKVLHMKKAKKFKAARAAA